MQHLRNLAIDGNILFKWILRVLFVKLGARFNWLRIGHSEGFCEHGHEPSIPYYWPRIVSTEGFCEHCREPSISLKEKNVLTNWETVKC
jgi:hypothetical protein